MSRRKIILNAASLVLLMLVVYPLSYAPVVRLRDPAKGDIPLYRPVDWMIDNTPLSKPVFAWARIWGVEDEFVYGVLLRASSRDDCPVFDSTLRFGTTTAPE